MSTALTTHADAEINLVDLCNHLAKSGMFNDARDVSKAIVKVLAGREYGFGPIASMVGIHVIEGKPSLGANLLASLIRRSGKYDYKVIEVSRKRCEIAFTENKLSCGPNIIMTIEEAMKNDDGTLGIAMNKDGKSLKANWSRHPDDMLFARCISKGYRRYCSDLAGGILTYASDELQEESIIDTIATPTSEQAANPQPTVNGNTEQTNPDLITKAQWTTEIEPLLKARPGYAAKLKPILGVDEFRDMPACWVPLIKEIIVRFNEPLEFQAIYLNSKALSEVDLLKRELVLTQLKSL